MIRMTEGPPENEQTKIIAIKNRIRKTLAVYFQVSY